ncbi:GNAT family N-acetyltransferase, partial [Actinomycetota bacterium]|nr:GNAT family N-acetyltransferase [Actinomycetota bacterium]
FYGNMDDAINAGDPSDRVFAWWTLDSASAISAARAPIADVDPADFDEARVITIPDDIVSLRTTDPDQARQWRMRVREQFLDALEYDFSVVGLDSHGSYVLAKGSTS